MIIEFFGPSGVGKSTIAQELSNNTRWEYIAINSRKEKLKYVIISLFRLPVRFLSLFCRTIIEGKYSLALLRHKIHLFTEYVARNEKARIKGIRQNVILDEGFAQYGLSLYEHNISKKTALRYVNKFILCNCNKIEVIILCNEQDRIKRMENRKRIPRVHLNIDNKTWQRIVSKNFDTFLNVLKRRNMFLFNSSKQNSLEIARAIEQKIK